MAKFICLASNHKVIVFDGEDHCATCLENEIIRLRAYVQRGADLLRPLAGNKVIDEYRKRANAVLGETLNT